MSGYFVPLTPWAAKAIAVALIAVLSAVNYVGVKEGAWVQRTFTCLKVAALVILIGAAFFSGHSAPAGQFAGQVTTGRAHFGVAMAACLMAYNGWSYVSFVAGEVRDPERNLLRSLVIGMAAVAVLYVSANLAYLKVMTIPEIAAAERVGADVATRTMGSIGGTFVSLAVLLSIIGRDQRLHPDGRADPVRAGAGTGCFSRGSERRTRDFRRPDSPSCAAESGRRFW